MNIADTPESELFLALCALQLIHEGKIASPYSGTVRLADYVMTSDDVKRFSLAWLTTVDGTPPHQDAIGAFLGRLLSEGAITFDAHRNMFDFRGLYKTLGYGLSTQANIPDSGCVVWGGDGIGAVYTTFDADPVPFDPGMTVDDFKAQFKFYNKTGNDVVLTLTAPWYSVRVIRDKWDMSLKDVLESFRGNLPVINLL